MRASSVDLLLRRSNGDILGASVQNGIRAVDTVAVADCVAGGVGGDAGEGEIAGDLGIGPVSGHVDCEGVLGGSPELKLDSVGAGGLVRGGGGGEAGEEGGSGSEELHLGLFVDLSNLI